MKNRKIGKDAAKITFSEIFTLSISLVSAMLLSRFRTLEEYGTYSQILLVTNLVSTIFMLGLPNSINYFLSRAKNDDERSKFLSTYYTLSTILGFLIGLVLILSSQLIVNYFDNPMLNSFIYTFALFPWARIIISSLSRVLIIYNKSNHLILFQVLNGLSLLSIIIFVRLFNLSFAIYMLLFIVIEVLFSLTVYLIIKKISAKLYFLFDRKYLMNIFAFSIPIGLASMVGTINKELDKIIIGHFFSTEEMAIFSNSAKELPVTFIANAFIAVVLPVIIMFVQKKKFDKAIDLWKDTIFVSFAFLAFFSLGIFVFAPEVITLLYSVKYLPGVSVFRVYAIVLLLRFTYFGIILNALGKTKFILYSSIGALILNVILNYLFYYTFGFIGPAVATLVSVLIMQFLQLLVSAKLTNFSLSKIFPWKQMFIIFIFNVILGIIMWYTKIIVSLEVYIGDIFESIILGIIWGVVFFSIYFKSLQKKWFRLNDIKIDNLVEIEGEVL